jgi:hypothetical protein
MADGSLITTIEGLAPDGDALHPIQAAFIGRGAPLYDFARKYCREERERRLTPPHNLPRSRCEDGPPCLAPGRARPRPCWAERHWHFARSPNAAAGCREDPDCCYGRRRIVGNRWGLVEKRFARDDDQLESSDDARSMLRSALPSAVTRTAANATSTAIDSSGIKETEIGGRSSKIRSAVTTVSAITETSIGHVAAMASSKPRRS